LRFDHISTTDRRGNNRDSTSIKFWKPFASERKLLKTSENCYKKHQKSLGKDEVSGSNPLSSSKPLKTSVFKGFYFLLEKVRPHP